MAWAAACSARVPFEVQDHGGFFDGGDVDEPLWPLRRRLAWFLARRAAAIRTVSPLSLDALRKRGMGERAYWLPIGADPRFSKIPQHPEPGLVVSVGRLVPVKRMEILIEAIAIRRRNDPSAKLVLVGDGPERARLETLAAQAAPGAVEFVGAGDPAAWLACASMFALASRHEGWGIAAVEAAMAGVPVRMSDTGCARWLAEQGLGKVVASADPAAWAAAMADVAPTEGRPVPSYPHGPKAQVEAWKRIASGDKS
jgi:glycosyltransferase involved in cell wall biosynthesis